MISDKLIRQINEFKELLVTAATQLVELKSENKALTEKNNELYESLMNNDYSLTEVKDVESDLRHKLKATEYRVEQLSADNEKLNDELEDKEILIEELKERDNKLTLENIELENSIVGLNKSVQQKDILIEDLNTSINHIKRELSEKKDLLFERDKTKDDLSENNALLKNEIYHLKQRLENYEQIKVKAKEYDEMVEKAKSDEEQLVKNIDELKQLTHALEEEHSKEKIMLNNEIETKTATIKLLESKLNDLSKKENNVKDYNLESEIANLKDVLEQKNKEINELNEAGYGVLGQTLFGTMDFNNTKLEKQSNALGMSIEDIEKKEFRIKLLDDENKDLKSKIDSQKTNIESLELLVKKRYKQIQILEEELNEAISYQMATKDKRLKLADNLEKYLQKIEKIIEN